MSSKKGTPKKSPIKTSSKSQTPKKNVIQDKEKKVSPSVKKTTALISPNKPDDDDVLSDVQKKNLSISNLEHGTAPVEIMFYFQRLIEDNKFSEAYAISLESMLQNFVKSNFFVLRHEPNNFLVKELQQAIAEKMLKDEYEESEEEEDEESESSDSVDSQEM